MLGPADFSILSGIPGQFDHSKVETALKSVAKAAQNTGKHWACTAGSVEKAKNAIEMGCRLVFHGADIAMIKNGLEQIQKEFVPLWTHLRESTRAILAELSCTLIAKPNIKVGSTRDEAATVDHRLGFHWRATPALRLANRASRGARMRTQ